MALFVTDFFSVVRKRLHGASHAQRATYYASTAPHPAAFVFLNLPTPSIVSAPTATLRPHGRNARNCVDHTEFGEPRLNSRFVTCEGRHDRRRGRLSGVGPLRTTLEPSSAARHPSAPAMNSTLTAQVGHPSCALKAALVCRLRSFALVFRPVEQCAWSTGHPTHPRKGRV